MTVTLLNTIPASAEEVAPLKAAKKSKSSSAKGILAAAATVSFIFGLLAATAVTPAPTRNGLAFDSQDLGRGQAVAAAAALNQPRSPWPTRAWTFATCMALMPATRILVSS